MSDWRLLHTSNAWYGLYFFKILCLMLQLIARPRAPAKPRENEIGNLSEISTEITPIPKLTRNSYIVWRSGVMNSSNNNIGVSLYLCVSSYIWDKLARCRLPIGQLLIYIYIFMIAYFYLFFK
jgi:hypothetical protein